MSEVPSKMRARTTSDQQQGASAECDTTWAQQRFQARFSGEGLRSIVEKKKRGKPTLNQGGRTLLQTPDLGGRTLLQTLRREDSPADA